MELVLRNGSTLTVDDVDCSKISNYKWRVLRGRSTNYAITNLNGKTVYLHRLIMDPGHLWNVDHINGNGLDNRRVNLRLASPSENQANAKIRKDKRFRYKGVAAKGSRYYASIVIEQSKRYLGCFKNAKSAARAYDKAARAYFGQYARLNFPLPGERGIHDAN